MKKPNVILITLDALRADHLGFMGYKKNTSPFFDSLAKRGVVFKKAFSVGAATPQAFVGIMTSTYPLDFGGYSRVTEKRTLVSEAFQKTGYYTAGFHSNAYLSPYFGYDRGWDEFQYLTFFGKGEVRPGLRRGTWQAKLTKKLFDWSNRASERSGFFGSLAGFLEPVLVLFRKIYLDVTGRAPAYHTAFETNEAVKAAFPRKPDKPVFLWVHYMDAHNPYALFMRKGKKLLPKIYSYFFDYLFTFFSESPRINRLFNKIYLRMYDESIRNIDDAAGDLFAYLSEIGVFDDETMVFITADHGEEFGEHGGYVHMQKAFNENIRVPLVAVVPEKVSGGSGAREIPRSTIDISPTMLTAAGISRPENFRGGNLFDASERDVIAELASHEADLSGISVAGRALVAEGHKLIKTDSGKFLFSLEDEHEKKNLLGGEAELAERLENKLERFKNV